MSRVRVRGWWMGPLVAAALLLTPWPAWFIEYAYSRGMYPYIQRVMTAASNRASWAVVDGLLLAAAAYVAWRLVRAVAAMRERGVGSSLWELLRRALRTSAFVACAFLVVWGLNYRRVPLERVLRGEDRVIVSPDDIQALAGRAVVGSRGTRPADPEPPAFEGESGEAFTALAARLAAPFQEALRQLGYPAMAVMGRPKVSRVLTPFFTAAGVTGMVNPLALESIVHAELLPFERPMVLAHEWAHLAGVADEADASAVAWLACTLGGTDLAYSGHVFVVIETSAALPRPAWRDLRAGLDPGVVRDLDALHARLTRQQPVVRETAFAVYDGYLKSNSVADGVRSYSRVLRVLAALAPRYPLSSRSRSSGVMGLDDRPVRRSSGSASGPSVSGR